MLYSEKKLKLIAALVLLYPYSKELRKVKKQGFSLESLIEWSAERLKEIGFSSKLILKLERDYKKIAYEEIKKAQTKGAEIICSFDKDYPQYLKEIYNPPSILYCLGDKSLLKSPCLAVVGSRKASSYGIKATQEMITPLSDSDLTIISGMAYGIDSFAHKNSLNSGIKTIGVNAAGLNKLYPSGNWRLAEEIAQKGLIISELPMDTLARPFLFPLRNRIIVGLSKAVLVVECGMKSGSFITANLALEENRELLAVPAPFFSRLTGCNELIKRGAQLIDSFEEILAIYNIKYKGSREEENILIDEKEKKILDLMSDFELKDIDYFVERLNMPVAEILSILMNLILKNFVLKESGGYVRIK